MHDLHGRESMQMQLRMVPVDGLQHAAVVLQLHRWSQSSLQADLSGPLSLRLCRPVEDLLGGEEITFSLLERAEPAGSGAIVGEVDIAVDHKGDRIPAALLAKGIGEAEEANRLLPEPPELIPIGIWLDGWGMCLR
jgi:hypothetical protein